MSEIVLTVNGLQVHLPVGSVVAAAITLANVTSTRHSIDGEARAPLCGIGVCFECRVTINGQPHMLSCQTLCEEGMEVVTT